MTNQLSDTEIDQHARRYAQQHQVSYAEALGQVVTMNLSSQSSPSNAGSEVQQPMFTEVQLDQMAQRLAREQGLDYFTALRMVNSHVEQASAKAQTSSASATDQKMHAAAVSYSQSHQVSYAQALERVAASFTASSFSEPVIGGADAVREIEGQPIEIFRAGNHIDSAGNTRIFTASDVQAMAASYNPSVLPAVLTIGHPDDNLPDYGRVQSLQSTPEGVLTMRVQNVAPKLATAIKQGHFKKRSASFLPPNSPSNPMPGRWYLRHVGWLGAQAPAVTGLADVAFAGSHSALYSFAV